MRRLRQGGEADDRKEVRIEGDVDRQGHQGLVIETQQAEEGHLRRDREGDRRWRQRQHEVSGQLQDWLIGGGAPAYAGAPTRTAWTSTEALFRSSSKCSRMA